MSSLSSPLGTRSNNNDEGQEGIVVAIRMRPLNSLEGDKQRVWKVLPQYSSIAQTTKDGKPVSERVTGRTFFTFDKTFGEDVDTAHVYDNVAKSIVSSAVGGLNGTIFAYGQTSSGKTYTMQGCGTIEDGSHAEGGVVHMAAKDIFTHITSQQDRVFLVRASFLEIYNEEVRDLLSTTSQTLHIREDPRRGVFVQSVEEIVTDFESLLKILFKGEKSRQIASTGMNERSSRSHTIFRITIESRKRGADEDHEDKENGNSPEDGAVRVSTLNLVDLAGSESVRHTGATGDRQKEGGMINQSLLTLSRVIVALGNPNQMHINFRDSKLTRLLQPSLSGNAKMAVICCATPSELYLEETRSTLQFASRAKLVKTNAKVNEILDDRSIIKRLQRELAEARRQSTAPGTEHLQALESRAASAGTAAKEAKAKLDRLKASILNVGYLFGTQDEGTGDQATSLKKDDLAQKARKRRQSDGDLFFNLKSPSKLEVQTTTTPSTEPKRKRTRRNQKQLSPKSEMSIVREALSSRAKMTEVLQNTVRNLKQSIGDIEDRFRQEKTENENQRHSLLSKYETLQRDHEKRMLEIVASATEKEKLEVEGASLRSSYEELRNQMIQSNDQNSLLSSELDSVRKHNSILMVDLENFRIQVAEIEALLQSEESKARQLEKKFDKSEKHVATIEHEKAHVEEEVETLRSEVATLKSELSLSRTALANSDSLVESLKSDNCVSAELARSLEIELKQVCAEKESAERKLSSIEAEKEEALSRNLDLGQKLDSASQQIRQIQSENTVVVGQHEAAYKELQGMLYASHTELKSVSNAKAELETTVKKLSAENSYLCSERDGLQHQLSGLETELRTHQSKISDIQAQKSEVEQELDYTKSASRKEIAGLQEKLSRAEGKTEQVQSEHTKTIEEHDAAYQQLQGQLSTSRQELERMEIGKAELEVKFEMLSAEHSDLCGERDGLVAELSQQARDLQSHQDEILMLRDGKLDVEQQLESIKTESRDTIAGLEEKLSVLKGQLHQMQVQFSTSQEDLDSLQNMKAELETTVQEINTQNANLKAERAGLQKRLSDSETELQIRLDEVAALREQKSDVEQQLESVKAECHEEIAGLKQELLLLEEKVQNMQSEKVTAVKEHEAAYEELQDKLSETFQERELIASKKTELETKVQMLRAENNTLCSERAGLEQKLLLLETDIQSHQDRISILHEERSAFEEEVDSASSESREAIAGLKKKLAEAEEQMHRVHGQLSASRQELETVESSRADLETRFRQLDGEKADLFGERTVLREKISHLEMQLQSHQDETSFLRDQKSDVERQLESVKTASRDAIAGLDEKLSAAEEETHQMQLQLSTSRLDVTSLENAKADLENTVEELSVANKDLCEERGRLLEKQSHLEASLQNHQDEISALRDQKSEVEQQLEFVKTESHDAIAGLKEKLSSLEEQMQLAESEHAKTVEEFDAASKQLQDQLSDSCEEIKLVVSAKTELEITVREFVTRTAELEDQRDNLELRIAELDSTMKNQNDLVSNLQTEKLALERELSSAASRLESAESLSEEMRVMNESLDRQLKEAISASEKEIGSLRAENVDLKQRMESMSHEKDHVDHRILQLEEKAAGLESQMEVQTKELAEYVDVKKHLVAVQEKLNTAEAENKGLMTTLDESRQSIDSLRQTVAIAEEQISTLRSANGTLKKGQEEADSAVEAAQHSISTKEQELHQIKDQLQHTNSEKETQNREHLKSLSHLEKVIAELNAEKEDLVAKTESCSEEATEANRRCLELEQQNCTLSAGLREERELSLSAQAERRDLDEKLAKTVAALERKNEETSALQISLLQNRQAISSMEEKLGTAEEHLKQTRIDNERIIAEQEEAYKVLETRLGEVFKGLELLKSEKSELLATVAEVESQKAMAVDHCKELESKNLDLQSDLRSHQTQLATLEEERNETESLLASATSDLTSNDAAIAEAQKTILALQKHLAAAEERAKKSVAERESAVSDLEARLSRCYEEVESLKAGKYDLETRIEELESGLDCQVQELEEKIVKLESENEDLKIKVEGSGVAVAKTQSEAMEIKSMTTAILAEKDALQAILSESQLRVHQLEDQLENALAEKEQILTDTALRLDEKQKEFEALIRTKKEIENELLTLQKTDEAAKNTELELKCELSLKKDLAKQLQERELEREEATAELKKQSARCRELSRALSDCLTKEREAQLLSEISDLKTETVELKQLLISANESEERNRNSALALESKCNTTARELDDALYRLSQLEEELRLSELPQSDTPDRCHSEVLSDLKSTKTEMSELKSLLEIERQARQKSEEELKRRMGDEQRVLIHEAENRMNELRRTAEQLQRNLEQSESEGYQARQEAEELRDQNKEVERSCRNLEGKIEMLKSAVERQENQISVLQSELKKAKAESYASKESAIEMKDRMRKASRENEKVVRESQAISSEISTLKRKIASLEREAVQREDEREREAVQREDESDRLKEKLRTAEHGDAKRDEEIQQVRETLKLKDDYIESLNKTVAKLEMESKKMSVELKMGQRASDGKDSGQLQETIEKLTKSLKQKDSRIKKLEAVRLTKDQVESIKKLKADNINFENKCSKLVREIAELKSQLKTSRAGLDSSPGIELSELRFDKQALESKLRKFAAHCQRLEDDKASMMDALKSCGINTEGEEDINDIIVSLCDKLAALEETKSRRFSEDNRLLESLRKENETLSSRIKNAEAIIKQSTTKEKLYMEKIEELQRVLEDSNENSSGEKSEISRKLQFLEQENLQLLLDNKSAKKQLQIAREEIEVLRMNAADNPTMEFSTFDFTTSDTADFTSQKTEKSDSMPKQVENKATTGSRARPSPLVDATNCREKRKRTAGVKNPNSEIARSDKRVKTTTRSPMPEIKRSCARTPGLGEPAVEDEENTAECKQS